METISQGLKQNQLDHVQASLSFLHPHMDDDYVVELSVRGCGGFSNLWSGAANSKGMTSGWFSNAGKMGALGIDIDQGWINKGGYKMVPEAIYVTMNPVDPALLSRAYNVVSPGAPRSTDKDVKFYHNIFIDMDASRPAETSASEAEKEAAWDTAVKIKDYLVKQLAWPEPMFCDSGNGYHLVFKCYFEASKENGALLKQFLLLLHDTFCQTPYIVDSKQVQIKVDSTVHNPARLIKLHGTTARKGMPTPNRPQRQSYVIELPSTLDQPVVSTVTLEQTIKILAQHLGKEAETEQVVNAAHASNPAGSIGPAAPARRPGLEEMFTHVDEVTPIVQGGSLDVQQYLNDNGFKVVEVRNGVGDAPTIYALERCVFDSSHSSKEAGIGQHQDGKLFYHCFHESCASDPQRNWGAARKIISGDAGLGKWMSGGSFGLTFPNVNQEGKPYANYENFKALIGGYGVKIWYNQMKRRLEADLPGDLWKYSDRKLLLTRALLIEKCCKHGMGFGQLDNWINLEAEENSIHPAKEWVQSSTWDGVDRLDALADTILVPEDQYHLWRLFLRKWLIQGVACLYHPHFTGKGVLTFTGAQNVGKTSWLRRLTCGIDNGFAEGAHLDPKSKDSVLYVIGSWIAELGELDATFNKGDIARIKAFLTNTEDKIRMPYAKDPEDLKRQTIFAATVNDPQFLVDSTGNSRWWVVETGYINYRHDVDVQQVWAQAFDLYMNGEVWHLSAGESDIQAEHNRRYEITDPIMEKIRECFKFDTPRASWLSPMTATQVMEHCGYRQPKRADTTKAGNILVHLVGRAERRQVKGERGAFYMMPVERSPFEVMNTPGTDMQGGVGADNNIIQFKGK